MVGLKVMILQELAAGGGGAAGAGSGIGSSGVSSGADGSGFISGFRVGSAEGSWARSETGSRHGCGFKSRVGWTEGS